MAQKTTIAPKNTWQKLLIYWHTKNHHGDIYDIAKILAVGIYTNQAVYEEELEEARALLHGKLHDSGSVNEVMEYIEMKLANYAEDRDTWHRDQRDVREMIEKDEELYGYLLSIFEADDSIDTEESRFEASLKKALLRS
jgi:hypothetical protein